MTICFLVIFQIVLLRDADALRKRTSSRRAMMNATNIMLDTDTAVGVHRIASTDSMNNASFGVKTDLKHVGDTCSRRDPCTSAALSDMLECHCVRVQSEPRPRQGIGRILLGGFAGDTGPSEDCRCRRPVGSPCMEASDCAHGCVQDGENACQCAAGAGAKSGAGAGNVSKICDLIDRCEFDRAVCRYNAWSARYWNTAWQDKSIFEMLSRSRSVSGLSNAVILKSFLHRDRLYAKRYSYAELLDVLASGAQFFYDNSAIGLATTFDSLPYSYSFSPGVRFLKQTGALNNPDTFPDRLQTTAITLKGVLEGMKSSDGKGLAKMFKLAKIHQGYDSRALNGYYGREWQETADPIISMEGMLWTELCFSVVALRQASKYKGMFSWFSEDQLNAYTVLWSVLGNAMGVPYEFASFADAAALFDKMEAGPDMVDRLPEDHPSRKAMDELRETFSTVVGSKSTTARIMGKFGILGLMG